MFQIEPILWLQGFASPALTFVMLAVTNLGYTLVYVALLVLASFWVRMRPALGVLLGILLAASATEGLKNVVALPRPTNLHAELRQPGGFSPAAAAIRRDGAGFWSLPDAAETVAVRAAPEANYGFPSGHAAEAMAFGLGLVLFVGRRRLLAFAVFWPIAMALSRMYLGRHFLADVLGGFAIGAVSGWAAWAWLRWLDGGKDESRPRRAAVTGGLVLALAALTVATPALEAQTVGRVAGVVAACLTLAIAGFPSDAGEPGQRTARMACAGLAFLATNLLAAWLLDAAGWEHVRLAVLLAAAINLGGSQLAGVAIGRRMGWFRATSFGERNQPLTSSHPTPTFPSA